MVDPMETKFSLEEHKREFERLRDNANQKRDWLLGLAYRQTRRRKRLNIAAGVLALLSAATVTSVLADFTPAPAMKVLAASLSTVSGLISLFGNIGFKDSEILDIYTGASSYLTLRERARRALLNRKMDGETMHNTLTELQDIYSELDSKYQRYVGGEGAPETMESG